MCHDTSFLFMCSLFYSFLEYVPGGSIASCLRKHGRFDEEVTKSFTGQILAGLEYLHSKNILHRVCMILSLSWIHIPNCDCRISRRTTSLSRRRACARSPTSVSQNARMISTWPRRTRPCRAPCSGWLRRSSTPRPRVTTRRSTSGVWVASCSKCGLASGHGWVKKPWPS